MCQVYSELDSLVRSSGSFCKVVSYSVIFCPEFGDEKANLSDLSHLSLVCAGAVSRQVFPAVRPHLAVPVARCNFHQCAKAKLSQKRSGNVLNVATLFQSTEKELCV